jgi:YD repeat-containing protein
MHYTKVVLNEETVMMTQRIAYSGTDAQYIGYAPPGTAEDEAGWIIHKLIYDSNSLMVSKLFAGGSKAFDKVWQDRAEYSYV